MLFPLLGWLLRLWGQRTESQTDERQLRRELLAHQRRQLIHQHIPDVHAARETFGPRFDELLQLLMTYDPAGIGATAATNVYYPELARTLLYQMARQAPTHEQLPELLRQELALWFGTRAASGQELTQLARAIQQWR